jgi:hypothetical protein
MHLDRAKNVQATARTVEGLTVIGGNVWTAKRNAGPVLRSCARVMARGSARQTANGRKLALPVTSRANPAARNSRSSAGAVCGSPFQMWHLVQVRRV